MTELVTVPNVELIEVGGEWEALTGVVSWSDKDASSAIRAQYDPAIRPPIIKFGHQSTLADGEPAVGKCVNLRLGNNGQTLIGDFVGVPKWLAECLASAYPRRSVEGVFNLETVTNNKYSFVITAVSLLGVAYPAVTTLKDIEALYSAETIDDLEMKEADVAKVSKGVSASLNISDLRAQFAEYATTLNQSADQNYWWIREIYIDPNYIIVETEIDNVLLRFDYTVDDSGTKFEFGEPTFVEIQYTPTDTEVAASKKIIHTTTSGINCGKINIGRPNNMNKAILDALGLDDSADDEAIVARIEELKSNAPETNGESESESEPEPKQEEESETKPETEIEVAASTVTIDAAAFATLKADAELGRKAYNYQRMAERDQYLDDAVKAGKFAPNMKLHYSRLYDSNEKLTRETIDTMAANVVPVAEIGTNQTKIDSTENAYPNSWLASKKGN